MICLCKSLWMAYNVLSYDFWIFQSNFLVHVIPSCKAEICNSSLLPMKVTFALSLCAFRRCLKISFVFIPSIVM